MHCNGRKVSSVGPEFARTRSIIFLIFGLVVLGIAIGITGEKEITEEINIFMIFSFSAGTASIAAEKGGMYVVYVGAFLVSFLLLFLFPTLW